MQESQYWTFTMILFGEILHFVCGVRVEQLANSDWLIGTQGHIYPHWHLFAPVSGNK